MQFILLLTLCPLIGSLSLSALEKKYPQDVHYNDKVSEDYYEGFKDIQINDDKLTDTEHYSGDGHDHKDGHYKGDGHHHDEKAKDTNEHYDGDGHDHKNGHYKGDGHHHDEKAKDTHDEHYDGDGHDHKNGHYKGDGHHHNDYTYDETSNKPPKGNGSPKTYLTKFGDEQRHDDEESKDTQHYEGDGHGHKHPKQNIDPRAYLTKFGYLNAFSFGEMSVNQSLKTFQKTFGLNQTGVLNKETITLMETPRCGMQDHRHGYSDRPWKTTELTYSFDNYTPDMSKAEVEQLIKQALNYWAEVTPLTFTKVEKDGDIEISFGSRVHTDHKGKCFYDFDGPHGVLAHAFFPESGRIHFDDEEDFTAHSKKGINFLWVATHELGHILGLEHDTVDKNAVMYPYYRHYTPDFKLHPQDVRRIKALYQKKMPRPGCHDHTRNCAKYKNRCTGHGHWWTKFMMSQCKKTCQYHC